MGFRSPTSSRALAALCFAVALATPAFARERILLAGDSWGALLAQYKSFEGALASSGIPDVQTVGIAVGGTTAAQWASPSGLATIDAALAAHPTIDVVYLSLGANDVVWNAFSLLQLPLAAREKILDDVVAAVGVVARHVVDNHTGVQVVIGGYDYVNLVDFRSRPRRRNPWHDQNAASYVLAALDTRYSALAATHSRFHHVSALGLMQLLYGDPTRGIPPQSSPWPGGYPFLPGPKVAFGDGAHLTPEGYYWFAWWQVFTLLQPYFTANP